MEAVMKTNFRHLLIGTLTAGAGLLVSALGTADTSAAMDPGRHAGRASVYRNLPTESLEATTPPDRIKAVASGRYAPTEIWRALEHGEKVECISCIPEVSKLLWNSNAKTREISAWWLRRRIIGVFGPGQIYSQVVVTLQTSPDETRRAYAADALGEFLSGAGVKYVSKAIRDDSSAKVRKSAVMALMRLNSQGQNGEVAHAMSDSDENVQMAALYASVRINVFNDYAAVVRLVGSQSARVRKRAAENLGVMRSADSVVALSAITSPETESNAQVRAAAVAALGKIADPGGKAAVQNALNDPNQFVRDAANIAMRRL
jgi:HEAT repeat protein